MSTQLVVGWLLLLAAVLVFVGGFLVRAVLGTLRDRSWVQRPVRAVRRHAVGRVLFGRVAEDALDDVELDSMILLPTITVSSGLCLTAVFLLGLEVLH